MVSKFRKSFISKGASLGEQVTFLVEATETNDFKGICIESLEGSYSSPDGFDLAYERHTEADPKTNYKLYNFMPMTLKTAITLRDLLNEAIKASLA